jgi:ABC-2 type transport system permease protein
MRYVTGILTYLLFISVQYFIWKALYDGHPAGTVINGFTMHEMVTYVAVGWMSRSLYFSSIDEEINEIVRSGQIGMYLIRPVNFHLMMLAQAFGGTLFRLIFFTVPVAGVILLSFPVAAPASAFALVAFLLSTFTSFFVLAEVGFLVGLLAFSLKSIQGVMRAKYYLIQLFSGLLLPLTFFPPVLQEIVNFLPFKLITYVPLQIYLGRLSSLEVIQLSLEQIAWGAALFVFSQWCWHRAMAKLTLQGG